MVKDKRIARLCLALPFDVPHTRAAESNVQPESCLHCGGLRAVHLSTGVVVLPAINPIPSVVEASAVVAVEGSAVVVVELVPVEPVDVDGSSVVLVDDGAAVVVVVVVVVLVELVERVVI